MPWRSWVPLIGKVKPERDIEDNRLGCKSLRALHLLGKFAAQQVGNVNFATLERDQPRSLIRNCSENYGNCSPLSAHDQWAAGSNRPVRASRIAARGLRPWRRPVDTMEQRSA